MVFLKIDGYQKMCDTNKNVIKIGMIIKGVYYNAKMHGISWRKLHGGTYIDQLSMEVSCLNLCFKFCDWNYIYSI